MVQKTGQKVRPLAEQSAAWSVGLTALFDTSGCGMWNVWWDVWNVWGVVPTPHTILHHRGRDFY